MYLKYRFSVDLSTFEFSCRDEAKNLVQWRGEKSEKYISLKYFHFAHAGALDARKRASCKGFFVMSPNIAATKEKRETEDEEALASPNCDRVNRITFSRCSRSLPFSNYESPLRLATFRILASWTANSRFSFSSWRLENLVGPEDGSAWNRVSSEMLVSRNAWNELATTSCANVEELQVRHAARRIFQTYARRNPRCRTVHPPRNETKSISRVILCCHLDWIFHRKESEQGKNKMGGPDEGQLIYENGIDRNVPRGSKK